MNIHTTFTHVFWTQELAVVYTWGVLALIRSVAFAEVFVIEQMMQWCSRHRIQAMLS